MKKFWLVLSILFCVTQATYAVHTKGGWMYYEYLGPGNAANTSSYRITLKVYTECVLNPGQADQAVNFTIFSAATFREIDNVNVSLASEQDISNCNQQSCYPCIQNIPRICYKIRTFSTVVELTNSPSGYIVAYQRCCRISNIRNIVPPSNDFGETWTVAIPGTAVLPDAIQNSSARFAQNDTAIICQNSFFTFDFSATDINGDSLVYVFTPAFSGASIAQPSPAASAAPPFTTIPYSSGFSGTQPLGNGVTINQQTGIVSGIAPAAGIYVVTVIAIEYKRGTTTQISQVRKSLHIEVANCNTTDADLKTSYTSCDGFTVTFNNEVPNVNVQTFEWSFGDGATSTDETPTHTYADTGVYILKLVVNRGLACTDSATSKVSVFPGYFPAFDIIGQCKNTPIQFIDRTTANYGIADKWKWNFGDPASGAVNNTSVLKSPTHVYALANTYNVELIVSSSKGCIDTITKPVTILDKPVFDVANDTLICVIDTLQLKAIGDGTVFWTPNYNISNVTSQQPLVSPDITTLYRVVYTDAFGCVGDDSVLVKVVSTVTQSAQPDTTICRTDSIVLRINSDALNYIWTETPAGNTLNKYNIKNPTAIPTLPSTRYAVVGSIGKCTAADDIVINTVPYPIANAGPDTVTCFGRSVQLNASGGSNYTWTPPAFLNNRFIPNPIAINPTASVRYIVTVTDVLGCPKPTKDTIFLKVDRVIADAGPRDTSVVLNQPLQLQATGSTNYLWDPPRWLTNAGIANPVSLPRNDIRYVVRVSNNVGCFDYDTIDVRVFFIEPGFYVPNAFTPNGDGKNDFFRPIAIGMKSVDLFRVFNRWGQLLYSSTDLKQGWDGTFRGKGQDPAAYVWYAQGTDYTNKKVFKKGSVILIRQ
jgi:gliding motility-associated-like protein